MANRAAFGLALVASASCGFRPGTGNGNAGDAANASDANALDGSHDGTVAPADATPSACMAAWFSGTPPTFAAATLGISELDVTDRDPMLVDDEKTLYFSSDRFPSSTGDLDIFVVSRASKTDAFDVANVAETSDVVALDDSFVEAKVAFSAAAPDDVIYDSNSPSFSDNLWHSTRTAGAFPAGDHVGLAAVNSTGTSQGDPSLSDDGLRLYFSAKLADGKQHIMRAARETISAAFGSGTEITELSSGLGDADPALTPGEQVIVFSSLRGSANGTSDIYYAVRDNASEPFASAQPLADLNSSYSDADPVISADGCRIYFATNRSNITDSLDYDLWSASMVLPAPL